MSTKNDSHQRDSFKNSQDDDPVVVMLDKTGCLQKHYDLQVPDFVSYCS